MKPIACIILPTYNEAANIPKLLPKIFAQAQKIDSHELHVLVVDDNSPDGTGEIVKDQMSQFPNLHLLLGEKNGLGDAYKRGISHAIENFKADILFEMDADLQHDPDVLPLFVALYNHGFSLVIGSRFLPGSDMPDITLYRRFLSLTGNWLIRIFSGLPRLRDFTSGYRCIQASIIKKCNFQNLSTTGYSFQTSLIFELLRNGAKVIEIPITFPDRKYGESKLSLPDQIEFLLNLLKIRFRESYEFVRFIIIGISGVLVNMGIYLTLTRLIGIRFEISSFIAIECSILFNFLIENLWALRGRQLFKGLFNKIMKFHRKIIVGVLFNYFSLLFLVGFFNIYDIFAYLFGIGVGSLINYSVEALFRWRRN